jgi:hypothetical protein
MSKSPLAGAFTENGAPEKKKNKKTGALLILAGVALTTSLGGVFAANITIASNGIEFGQGVATVTTCDTTINASIEQTFDNNNDAFYVGRIGLTNIDPEQCAGKKLHVTLLNSSGTAICDIAGTDSASSPSFGAESSGVSTATDSSADVIAFPSPQVTDATEYQIGITAAASCPAADVNKVTLTTSN